MKTLFKAALLAAAPVMAVAALPTAASAQAVNNVAVADLEEAIGKSAAYTAAVAQIKTTYAAQIAQADARAKALTAEIQPMATAYQTAARAPNANQAALQTQLAALQKKERDANAEVSRISEPVARARAYAVEQIQMKLETAVTNAMNKNRVTILIQPNAAIKVLPTADLTNSVMAELNALVPTVGITPPAGWQPGQAGQGQAPAPAQPQPQGR